MQLTGLANTTALDIQKVFPDFAFVLSFNREE